jgi:hypothetical protein
LSVDKTNQITKMAAIVDANIANTVRLLGRFLN